LHSCQPAQPVKRVCPFPLPSLLVTVIDVCVCVCVCLCLCVCLCARACMCVSWPACWAANGILLFGVVLLDVNALYHLFSPCPLPALFPPIVRKIIQLHCREKLKSRQVNRRNLMSPLINSNHQPCIPKSFSCALAQYFSCDIYVNFNVYIVSISAFSHMNI